MSSTYTPETEGAWFQDVEISPDTLADGTLAQRLDPILYPQLGVTGDPVAGTASIVLTFSPASPHHTDAITITVTVTTGIDGVEPSGDVVNVITLHDGLTHGVALVDGVGTYDQVALAAGTYGFKGEYDGDENTPHLITAEVDVVVIT